MKMHFTVVITGKDSLEIKLADSIQKNSNLHMDLIRSFGQIIMLALRLNEEDEVCVESFRVGKVIDDEKPILKEVEKKVDK